MGSDGRRIAELVAGESAILPAGPNGDPPLGRLKLWATNDVLQGQQIHFRARGQCATLSLGGVGFIAKDVGDPGNLISVSIDVGDHGTPIGFDVKRFFDGTSKIAIACPGAAAAVKATMIVCEGNVDTEPADPTKALLITAKAAGAGGNGITMPIGVGNGGGNAIAVTDNEIDITIDTSTNLSWAGLRALILGNADAAALVDVALVSGAGAAHIQYVSSINGDDAINTFQLAGGLDLAEIVSTVDELVAAATANADVSSLVHLIGNGSPPWADLVEPGDLTALTGGDPDALFESTFSFED